MQDNIIAEYVERCDLTGDLAWIADTCGIETARQLLACCRGMSIYVPLFPRQAVKRCAEDLRSQGLTDRSIALRLGLTDRTVSGLLRPEGAQDALQGELFEGEDEL